MAIKRSENLGLYHKFCTEGLRLDEVFSQAQKDYETPVLMQVRSWFALGAGSAVLDPAKDKANKVASFDKMIYALTSYASRVMEHCEAFAKEHPGNEAALETSKRFFHHLNVFLTNLKETGASSESFEAVKASRSMVDSMARTLSFEYVKSECEEAIAA